MQRFSGKNIDISIGGRIICVETINLTVSDSSAVTKTQGIPDGYVDGEVSAEGDIELTTKYLDLLIGIARESGSFRGIPPQDFLFYGKLGGDGMNEFKVEAFGCKLKLDSIVSVDSKGGEASKHTIKYEVTSPEFVRINDVPYLSESDTRNLKG